MIEKLKDVWADIRYRMLFLPEWLLVLIGFAGFVIAFAFLAFL